MIDWSKRKTKDEIAQAEQDEAIELSYQELIKQIDNLEVLYDGHIFSGSVEHQSYIVSMLTKIEGSNPNATRNVYAIDGRTKVPFTKSDMLNLMSAIDIAQEEITDV